MIDNNLNKRKVGIGMRNVKNRLVATVLASILIIICFSNMVVYADESRGSCVTDHFGQLNYGSDCYCPPSQNTCGYTAMSMLLSYYDSYWRDDFIVPINGNDLDWDDGIYDSYNDVIDKTFSANSEYIAWYLWNKDANNPDRDSYNKFSLETENEYLESYLLSLEREWKIGIDIAVTGIYYMDGNLVRLFLEKYLYEERSFTSEQIAVNFLRRNDVGDDVFFDTIEQQIENGNPLIFYGCRFAEQEQPASSSMAGLAGAHLMVAYGITGEGANKDILLHTGWTGGEYVKYKTTVYKYFNSIVWLEINEENLPHQCTDAYRDYSDATKTYCACQIYSTHPSHNSNHISISGNSDCDEAYHWTNGCHCGKPGPDSVVIPHDLSYVVTPGSTTHYVECDECGYSDCVDHNYNQLISVSDTHHVESCACGAVASTQEAHVATRCVSNGTSLHGIYCKCGYLISQDLHEMLIIDLRYSKCMYCGYVRDNSVPGQIIMGVEDEAENSEE